MKRPTSTPPPPHTPARPIVRNKRAIPRQATSNVAFERETPQAGDPLLDFDPVVTPNQRKNSITPVLQRAFIAHLAANGIVRDAARHIGRSSEALYRLRQRPDATGFRMAWERALDWSMTRLEDSAFARALQGEERPVFARGELIGSTRHYNDALVMFFLRNRLPQRYGAYAQAMLPGDPAYEALKADLRAQWEQEQAEARRSPENQAANLAFFADIKARWRREWEVEREYKLCPPGTTT